MKSHRNYGRACLGILVIFLLNGCLPASRPPTPTPITTGPQPPAPITPTASPLENSAATRLAWFYKPPPNDADMLMLAHEFQFFILTHGNEQERNQLLALGAPRPILEYIRFDAIHDPHDCTAQPRRNQAAYEVGDFCRISSEHPDWFLLNQNGERISLPYGDQDYVMMDPGNAGWRAFFLQRVEQIQADPNWGGVFLDNVEVTLAFRENDGQLPQAYPDEASYQNAVQGFLKYLYTGYFQPNHKLMYANIVARKNETDWTSYLTWLDGAMHEGWAVDWPNRYRDDAIWEQQMTLAEQTQAMGKFIILVSQGTQDDVELQKFAFASYLLVNQGKAAFRYAASGNYSEAWTYADYNYNLGVPLGPRYKEGDAWYRNYSHGLVMVNPIAHEAMIEVFPK